MKTITVADIKVGDVVIHASNTAVDMVVISIDPGPPAIVECEWVDKTAKVQVREFQIEALRTLDSDLPVGGAGIFT